MNKQESSNTEVIPNFKKKYNTASFAQLFESERELLGKTINTDLLNRDNATSTRGNLLSLPPKVSVTDTKDEKSQSTSSEQPILETLNRLGIDRDEADDLRPEIENGHLEPFVSYVPEDLVALCSSGGGIRSSTFSLGVLQGLANLKLLPMFDYHSTVSGGGYTGGWWSTWRRVGTNSDNSLFPISTDGIVEPSAIRHLRENSNFLSPRGTSLNGDLWRGASRLLLGAISTTGLVCSLLLMLIGLWLSAFAINDIYAWCQENHKQILELSSLRTPAIFFGILVTAMLAVTPVFALLKSASEPIIAMLVFGVAIVFGYFLLLGFWYLAGMAISNPLGALAAIAWSLIGISATRWVAGWSGKQSRNQAPSAFRSLIANLTPTLIALATLSGLCFLVMIAIRFAGGGGNAATLSSIMGVAGLLAVISTFSVRIPSTLHQFYREQILKVFGSLSNDQFSGDVKLEKSNPGNRRPHHVINCCASDTDYQALRRKDRRGASATFSSLGFNLGNQYRQSVAKDLTVGEALTTSAAAVDPAMGMYSSKVGSLLSLVLFGANLRLGTWVSLGSRYTKVLRPWKEALSRFRLSDSSKEGSSSVTDVHLTDGGHFENLAAYEMFRRRCRYIVICDGGADPDITFSDFSNLQQLVREDFGVEIDINLDVLRPDKSGHSEQHLVAGKIKYRPLKRIKQTQDQNVEPLSEDGILIYIKPTLTGDEPEDITQYKVRNTSFPHESTGDQFYDSFQWEAYRRLGEHVIETGFAFSKAYRENGGKVQAPRLFDAAYREWNSLASAASTALPERVSRIPAPSGGEDDDRMKIMKSAFPELFAGNSDKSEVNVLSNVIHVMDDLERAFYARAMTKKDDHLDNWGWENWADRLSASTQVRKWWPFVAPLYSLPFRNQFMGVRYALNELLPVIALKDAAEKNKPEKVFSIVEYAAEQAASSQSGTSEDVVLGRIRDAYKDHPCKPTHVLLAKMKIPLTSGEDSGNEVVLGGVGFELKSQKRPVVRLSVDGLQIAAGYWSAGINKLLADALLVGCRWASSDQRSFEVPWNEKVGRVEVYPGRKDARKVKRPSQRHFWTKRGFVQKKDSSLVLYIHG